MNDLILHCGSEKVTRNEIAKVVTPLPTETHRPVSHIKVANLIYLNAKRQGYEVVSEEFGLSPDGAKMFGVLRFRNYGTERAESRALGFRNSHDKTLAVSLTTGLSVMVCDNLCFGGEYTISRKHTSKIEISELVPEAFRNLEMQFRRLEERTRELKQHHITDNQAKLTIVKAARMDVIPASHILKVLDEYKEPRHEEFRENTSYSLMNAFTETFKEYSNVRQDKSHRKLSELFELR